MYIWDQTNQLGPGVEGADPGFRKGVGAKCFEKKLLGFRFPIYFFLWGGVLAPWTPSSGSAGGGG